MYKYINGLVATALKNERRSLKTADRVSKKMTMMLYNLGGGLEQVYFSVYWEFDHPN